VLTCKYSRQNHVELQTFSKAVSVDREKELIDIKLSSIVEDTGGKILRTTTKYRKTNASPNEKNHTDTYQNSIQLPRGRMRAKPEPLPRVVPLITYQYLINS